MHKKVSICVPFHWMDNWDFFLNRCLKSIESQSFKDYEVILVKSSNMPITSNRAIESATGEIIKIIYMDDYFAHENALQEIVDNFHGGWLVTGCVHDTGNGKQVNYHAPSFSGISGNINTIGSPSVMAYENTPIKQLFNPALSWVLDIDLYKRLYQVYGDPTYVNTPNVVIGIGAHQMTSKLTDEEKQHEERYLYEN